MFPNPPLRQTNPLHIPRSSHLSAPELLGEVRMGCHGIRHLLSDGREACCSELDGEFGFGGSKSAAPDAEGCGHHASCEVREQHLGKHAVRLAGDRDDVVDDRRLKARRSSRARRSPPEPVCARHHRPDNTRASSHEPRSPLSLAVCPSARGSACRLARSAAASGPSPRVAVRGRTRSPRGQP